MFTNVIEVIRKAKIDVAVMGDKAFKESGLHHKSAEGQALQQPVELRKAEAVKFVPFLTGEAEPQIKKGDVVEYFKHENLSLTINQFSDWLEGTAAAAQPRAKRSASTPKAAPVAKAVEQATDGVTITKEQHQFYSLLLEAANKTNPEILTVVYQAMREQKIREAEERIKAELDEAMGGIAAMIPQPEPQPTVWEYDAEIVAKAEAALEKANKGEKVPAKVIAVAKLVMNGAATDDAQIALLG